MSKCPICNFSCNFLTSRVNRLGDQYNYVVCENCRFLFEKDLVEHSAYLAKKVSNIYQKDYFESTDVGWKMRGDGFLKIIKKIITIYRFLHIRKKISILDYGGGNGYLASKLSSRFHRGSAMAKPSGQNFNVLYYDKFEKPNITGGYKVLEKPVKADIMYAVELVEHITDIHEWDFLSTLRPDVFVFTTCLLDTINPKEIVDWPYVNPDAGHVALYSCRSLYLLGKKYGYMYFFFPNISCHIFLKSKFLNNINFVAVEYFIYNILRKAKNMIKKMVWIYRAIKRYLFKDTKYLFLYLYRYFQNNYHNNCKFYTDQELANFIKEGKSILRLGDGEMSVIHFLNFPDNSPQDYNDALRSEWLKIIKNYNDDSKYILGVPFTVNYTNTELKKVNRWEVCRQLKITYELIFNKNATYFDALAFYKDGGFEKFVAEYIKNKKVIIVTNEENIKKIASSTLASKEYIYVTCKDKNAYEDRLKIQKEIIEVIDKSGLPKTEFVILLSAGQIKTILDNMSDKGYQILDIGRGLEHYYTGTSIEHII